MTQKNSAPKDAENNSLNGRDVNSQSVLLEIQKNKTERIRVAIRDYRGKQYVDVRTWYPDESGTFLPSNKGISIRPELITQVIQGLMLAGRATGQG